MLYNQKFENHVSSARKEAYLRCNLIHLPSWFKRTSETATRRRLLYTLILYPYHIILYIIILELLLCHLQIHILNFDKFV